MPSIISRRTHQPSHHLAAPADRVYTVEEPPRKTIITGRAKDKHGRWGEFKIILSVQREKKIVRSSRSQGTTETIVSYHTSLEDVTFHADDDNNARITTINNHKSHEKSKRDNGGGGRHQHKTATKEEKRVHWEDEHGSNLNQVLETVARSMNVDEDDLDQVAEKREKRTRHRRTHY
mmetsp:Transcript_18314/g.28564  ORF Transcript_18314/g.28564 Transcript_18314/m.28564 type:complete len:177 (-) Transcript_18314:132-662(-)